ncbi:hypothetical protein ACFSX9_11360 [Flavobacterium ardleyense]|uniref:Uncharacterized protein n=1 Tax=Flavobacterium ardleyense TaxID=2038737 RepID=A0ABW5Z927_9FLAO
MFKDIQKKLLLKYPLLWNTKFIPMITIGIIFQILFFGLGYIDGTIDFSGKIIIDIMAYCMLIGILAAVIILILWLVAYFKNNALKSFYSKSKYSLFFEWLQIFTICFLLATFFIPFKVGKQLHQKSYYSLEETTKRCKTISTADVFIDGSFGSTEIDSLASGLIDSSGNKILRNNVYDVATSAAESAEEAIINMEYVDEAIQETIYKDYIIFNNRMYDEYSLLNRNVFEFSVISREQDSLNKIQINNWLVTKNEIEVKKLMTDYLNIIREHNLATNLDLNKWFEIMYSAPEFTEYLRIQPYLKENEADRYNSYHYRTERPADFNQNNYSKYYVQQDVLKDKYDTVSDAHTDIFVEIELLLGFLYGVLGLSLLIFSFRVTSGKSWLIAIVVVGIINLITGIITAIFSEGILYPYQILATIIGIIIYFFLIYFSNKSLKLSRIALNIALWSFTLIIPIIYFLIIEMFKPNYYVNDYYQQLESPVHDWLREHQVQMMCANFILSVVILFLVSKVIRNWKGIAED